MYLSRIVKEKEFLTKSRQNDVAIRDEKTCFLFQMWRNANLSLNVALVRNDPHATGGTARWRWIISSCGMPACVTTQGSSRSPKGSLAYIYIYIKMCFLALQHFFSLPAAVFPRALGSVASREPARTPYASLDPSRGPWDVLLGFKVARPLGDAFRSPRAIQAHVNQRTENVMNLSLIHI